LEPVLRRTLGPQIGLTLELASELRPVRVDPGQLSQVLLNLILNAHDAMPTGGTVTIATGSITLGFAPHAPRSTLGEPVLPGAYATLCVTDTGLGIDHDTLGHIFEPFFTTKPIGAGTGLGLSTVHGIVRQSNGYICVDSSPGRGTAFTLYLPHVETAIAQPQDT
jgi:signal transduction histidine kinase